MAEKKKELVTIELSERWLPEYRISTGVVAFDRVLNGGVPSGRLTELFGGESAYKSLVVLQTLADAVKDEKLLVVLVDTENSIEKGLVDMVKLDVDRLLYVDVGKMRAVEDIFDNLEAGLDKALAEEKRLVFAWDSLATTPGYEDLVGTLGRNEASMRRAKLIKSGLDKYMGRVAGESATIIIVNQIQDRIGISFGDQTTTPGGKSVKHWGSVRMQFRTVGKIRDDKSKEQIGTKGHLYIKKHKAGKPFGEVNFEQYAGESLHRHTGLLDYMVRHGEIIQAGAWYHFPGDEGNKFRSAQFHEFMEKKNG